MECDCIADRVSKHLMWLFGTPDNFLIAVYIFCAMWCLACIYMLIAEANEIFAEVGRVRHQRRMEEMDKIIELEKVKAVAVSPPPPVEPPPTTAPEPAKEAASDEPPA